MSKVFGAHLRAAREADEEVKCEEDSHEDLAMFLDPLELVAERRDDRLRPSELRNDKFPCTRDTNC